MRMVTRFAAVRVGVALLVGVAAAPTLAATGTWSGGAGATWDTTTTNWLNLTSTPWDLTNGGTNTAVFSTTGATPTVSGTVYANALNFTTTGTISGGMIMLAGTLPTITTSSAATIGSVLGGSAGLVKAGTSTLILTASNAYIGTTTINAGTLQIGNGGSAGTLGVGAVVNGGTLAFNRTGSLTVANDISGTGRVTFNAGSITLSGSNTYTGPTSFTASSTISVSSFNSVSGGQASSSLGAPTTAANGTITFGGANGITSRIIYMGTGETTDRAISSTSGGAGSTVTLEQAGTGLLKFTGNITRNASSTSTLILQGSTSGTGEISGVISMPSGFFPVTKQGTGTWILSGSNTYARETTINAGTLQIGNGGTTGSLSVSSTISGSAGGTLAFNRTNTITQGTHFISVISGSINVTQLGSGTLALNGLNTYTGTTRLAAGTLQVADASALGTGTISFGGGTLQYSGITTDFSSRFTSGTGQSFSVDTNGQNVQFGSALTSSGGSLTKFGAGTLTLSAANTYAGKTSVNAGTLALSGNGALATTGTVDMAASGAALDLSGITASGLTIGALSGSTGSVVTLGSKTLTFGDATSTTFAGAIGGTGGLTKLGIGTVTFSGSSGYTGATTVAAGSFAVNGSLTNATLDIAAGATLMGSGTIGGLTTVAGLHSPGNSPGIETFANLTYANGAIVLWELWGNTSLNSPLAYDQIIVNGDLAFSGLTTLSLAFTGSASPSNVSTVDWTDSFWNANQEWLLYDVTGTTTGFTNTALNVADWLDSNGMALQAARPGSSFVLEKRASDVYMTYVIVVPEPAALALAGSGAALAAWAAARRRTGRAAGSANGS